MRTISRKYGTVIIIVSILSIIARVRIMMTEEQRQHSAFAQLTGQGSLNSNVEAGL